MESFETPPSANFYSFVIQHSYDVTSHAKLMWNEDGYFKKQGYTCEMKHENNLTFQSHLITCLEYGETQKFFTM